MTDPRSTYRWKLLRAQLCKAAVQCAMCGRALNHHARPRSTSRPSLDHIVPIAHGGCRRQPKTEQGAASRQLLKIQLPLTAVTRSTRTTCG
jgi:hypothetical protein